MDIREIDDRYPEYALPYEPVKGGKHYKKLGFPATALVLAGLFVVFWACSLISSPASPPPVPPGMDPVPPVTDPAPPVTEPDPPVIIPPDGPIVIPPDDTDDPVEDPVDAGPKGPEVSLSAINYWFELYHAEVIYVIIPNDATDITSSAVVTSSREPAYSFEIPLQTGSGTIRYNGNVVEHMELLSADYWKCDITVNYTLEGEKKSETFNLGASPSVADYLRLYDTGTSSLGPVDAKSVTSNLSLYYPSDYRHTFDDTGFWYVTIGWMDSSFNVLYEDEMNPVWYGSIGTGPFSGPSEAVSDSGGMRVDYVYSGTVNATPPAGVDNAAYFFLRYSFGGDASDTFDGSMYDVRGPESVRSYPQPLADTSYTEPTVILGDITYWGDLNIDAGLHHLEVDYRIELPAGNAALYTDFTSSVTVKQDPESISDPSYLSDGSVTSDMNTGTGAPDLPLRANMDTAGILRYNSVERWIVTVNVNYKYNGVPMSMSAAFTGRHPDISSSIFMSSSDSGELIDISIIYPADDPHRYAMRFTKVEIEFAKEDDYGYIQPLGERLTVWEYTDETDYAEHFGGFDPNDTTQTTVDGSEYTLIHYTAGTPSEVYSLKPTDATHYRVIYHLDVTGTDERDPGAIRTYRYSIPSTDYVLTNQTEYHEY